MYARCRMCADLMWVQPTTLAHIARIKCRTCGHIHPLGDVWQLGTPGPRHQALAADLARTHRLDLPGAYSVLLGFMSTGQARAVSATERLVELHGLSHDLAAKVAAGEIGLSEARKVRAEPAGGHRPPFFASTSVKPAVVAGVAGVLSVLLAIFFQTKRNAPVVDPPVTPAAAPAVVAATTEPSDSASREPRRPPGTEVLFDDAGRLVRVVASVPQGVLLAYCQEEPSRRPLELSSTRHGDRNTWFGVFRDYDDLERLWAITIHKDWQTRRWAAGDGTAPLQAFAIDPERLGDRRISVRAR